MLCVLTLYKFGLWDRRQLETMVTATHTHNDRWNKGTFILSGNKTWISVFFLFFGEQSFVCPFGMDANGVRSSQAATHCHRLKISPTNRTNKRNGRRSVHAHLLLPCNVTWISRALLVGVGARFCHSKGEKLYKNQFASREHGIKIKFRIYWRLSHTRTVVIIR